MTITAPGTTLHYEVHGLDHVSARRGGPLLVVVGSPMAAAEFAVIADAMATDRTVVTVDPRGYGASTLDDPDSPSTPEIRADDVVAVLDELGADTSDVLGSSGGAVTGLALVTNHPGRVRTLIAHEPPLLELLPDAAALRASSTRVVIGLGETSATLLTDATSRATAELLGCELAMFPGGHGGFIEAPAAFADRLREVLGG